MCNIQNIFSPTTRRSRARWRGAARVADSDRLWAPERCLDDRARPARSADVSLATLRAMVDQFALDVHRQRLHRGRRLNPTAWRTKRVPTRNVTVSKG